MSENLYRTNPEDSVSVVWDERYQLGIPEIDAQHRQLINLTNELYQGCMAGDEAAKAYFTKTIHGTVDYVKTHFSYEEKMLAEAGYPYLAWHKAQHAGFIKQILDDAAKFNAGEKFVPNKFVRFLRDWILSHIAMTDRNYAAFILHGEKSPPPELDKG
jgi:hemerythrin